MDRGMKMCWQQEREKEKLSVLFSPSLRLALFVVSSTLTAMKQSCKIFSFPKKSAHAQSIVETERPRQRGREHRVKKRIDHQDFELFFFPENQPRHLNLTVPKPSPLVHRERLLVMISSRELVAFVAIRSGGGNVLPSSARAEGSGPGRTASSSGALRHT